MSDPNKADQRAIATLREALAFWRESRDTLTAALERRIEQAEAWLSDQEAAL